MGLVRRVERIIKDERLLNDGDSIIVAVSGGPDSVALLHILFLLSSAYGWKLAVAHFDHRFRGDESRREAEFVAALAARYGLPADIGSADVPAHIAATGRNPQDAARELRYRFLLDAARSRGAAAVALGHHADDQAETVLMRLLRGAGLPGLAGMPIRRPLAAPDAAGGRDDRSGYVSGCVELVRPLLRERKEALLDFCRSEGLEYRIDSSNDEPKYVRNRIRLELMPQLAEYNPQIAETLNRLAMTAAAENDWLEQQAAELFRRLVVPAEGGLSLSRDDFAGVHLALQRRLIKLILNYLHSGEAAADFVRTEQVRTAAVRERPTTAALDLTERIRFVREYDRLLFVEKAETAEPYCYRIDGEDGALALPIPGTVLQWRTEVRRPGDGPIRTGPDEAAFDRDWLAFPLFVRTRRSGDRIRLFGSGGTKKVKDVLIDAKIPPSERRRLPIVADRERVLWIAGVRRSAWAPVDDSTVRVLRMQLVRRSSGVAGENETDIFS